MRLASYPQRNKGLVTTFPIFDSKRSDSFFQYLLRKRCALSRVGEDMSDRKPIDSPQRGHLDPLKANATSHLKMQSSRMLNHIVRYFCAHPRIAIVVAFFTLGVFVMLFQCRDNPIRISSPRVEDQLLFNKNADDFGLIDGAAPLCVVIAETKLKRESVVVIELCHQISGQWSPIQRTYLSRPSTASRPDDPRYMNFRILVGVGKLTLRAGQDSPVAVAFGGLRQRMTFSSELPENEFPHAWSRVYGGEYPVKEKRLVWLSAPKHPHVGNDVSIWDADSVDSSWGLFITVKRGSDTTGKHENDPVLY